MMSHNRSNLLFHFLVLVGFVVDGVRGKYGCVLTMQIDRLEETVDASTTTRRLKRHKFKTSSKGKFRRLYNVFNRVARRNGYPAVQMSSLDHCIETCGGDNWPWPKVNPEDFLDCTSMKKDMKKNMNKRDLQEGGEAEEVEAEKVEDNGFVTAMEGGEGQQQQQQQRNLFDWNFSCGSPGYCEPGCGAMPGIYNCGGYERRRRGLGESLAQDEGRLLMSTSQLDEIKRLKNVMTSQLLNACDTADLRAYNCSSASVTFECPITDNA